MPKAKSPRKELERALMLEREAHARTKVLLDHAQRQLSYATTHIEVLRQVLRERSAQVREARARANIADAIESQLDSELANILFD